MCLSGIVEIAGALSVARGARCNQTLPARWRRNERGLEQYGGLRGMVSTQIVTAPSGSLAAQAHSTIRDLIVTLRLPPGAIIQEEVLSKTLGYGRTPIREALIRLAQENLVTVAPRRGTFVSEINLTDLAQISEVRIQLEGFAAALAAQRINEAERRVADTLLADLALLAAEHDPFNMIELDKSVHFFVYRCAKNPLLEESLVRYFNLSLRIWHLALDRVTYLHSSVSEHRELLQAVKAGAAKKAQQIAAQHVKSFEAEIRKVI